MLIIVRYDKPGYKLCVCSCCRSGYSGRQPPIFRHTGTTVGVAQKEDQTEFKLFRCGLVDVKNIVKSSATFSEQDGLIFISMSWPKHHSWNHCYLHTSSQGVGAVTLYSRNAPGPRSVRYLQISRCNGWYASIKHGGVWQFRRFQQCWATAEMCESRLNTQHLWFRAVFADYLWIIIWDARCLLKDRQNTPSWFWNTTFFTLGDIIGTDPVTINIGEEQIDKNSWCTINALALCSFMISLVLLEK